MEEPDDSGRFEESGPAGPAHDPDAGPHPDDVRPEDFRFPDGRLAYTVNTGYPQEWWYLTKAQKAHFTATIQRYFLAAKERRRAAYRGPGWDYYPQPRKWA